MMPVARHNDPPNDTCFECSRPKTKDKINSGSDDLKMPNEKPDVVIPTKRSRLTCRCINSEAPPTTMPSTKTGGNAMVQPMLNPGIHGATRWRFAIDLVLFGALLIALLAWFFDPLLIEYESIHLRVSWGAKPLVFIFIVLALKLWINRSSEPSAPVSYTHLTLPTSDLV